MSKRQAPVYEGEQSGTKRLRAPGEMVCIYRFLVHCRYTAVKNQATNIHTYIHTYVRTYIHTCIQTTPFTGLFSHNGLTI